MPPKGRPPFVRPIATCRDEQEPLRFDVPASGTYLIKIGRHAPRKVVVIK